MANPQLAAASLLAKKLATPNTCAVFDFRLGPAGNIGSTLAATRRAKTLLLRIADLLALRVDAAITEDRVFPCTALGRLESLFLLWRIVENRKLLRIDNDHLRLCIAISAKACHLADPEKLSVDEITMQLHRLLRNGEVKRRFLLHLEAQGATLKGFEQLLGTRDTQRVIPLHSQTAGYWLPPDLNRAKQWIKQEQERADRMLASSTLVERQVGLRLCQSPGAKVRRGEVVVKLRYPHQLAAAETPLWLTGTAQRSAVLRGMQLLD